MGFWSNLFGGGNKEADMPQAEKTPQQPSMPEAPETPAADESMPGEDADKPMQ